jgi:hypothetical protein
MWSMNGIDGGGLPLWSDLKEVAHQFGRPNSSYSHNQKVQVVSSGYLQGQANSRAGWHCGDSEDK